MAKLASCHTRCGRILKLRDGKLYCEGRKCRKYVPANEVESFADSAARLDIDNAAKKFGIR